jgi:hypothetical protein
MERERSGCIVMVSGELENTLQWYGRVMSLARLFCVKARDNIYAGIWAILLMFFLFSSDILMN